MGWGEIMKEKPTIGAKKKHSSASFQDCYVEETGNCDYPTLRLALLPGTDWVSEHITQTVL